ncbi:MAG: hypothetical protein ISS93_03135 [Candidatus Aenigmarchaeota archaeon]|nr:hypothetical protein [Candidatus Aenigmarchaeota archaeon]
MGTTKLKLGFYGVTGCAGCQLSVIFQDNDILDIASLVDIQAWPFIKDSNDGNGLDYTFVEGLVANNDDKEVLLGLRKKTKFLVALGACAHTGCIPAYRQFTLKKNYTHLLYQKLKRIRDTKPSPLSDFVKVDFTIPGCPPSKKEILEFVKTIAAGRKPHFPNRPVCFECRQNQSTCLLDLKKPCLGPITRGGCGAVCPAGGFECWGCRGPTDDANIKSMVDILRKHGHKKKFIKDRLVTFSGAKTPAVKRFVYGKNNKD